MAINNYDTLLTAVENWLDNAPVTAQIPDFIMLGERRIYRKLRIRPMETDISVTIAGGEAAAPTAMVELKHLRVVGTDGKEYTMESRTPEWIYHNYPKRSVDGRPRFFAREGDSFIFGPYPDQNYVVKGKYYARLTALSSANSVNWFTSNAPDVLLAAALVEATPFVMEDERLAVWAPKLETMMMEIQKEDDRERISGGPKWSMPR